MLEKIFAARDALAAAECNRAIHHWLATQTWTEMRGYVLFSMRLRLSTAMSFALKLDGPKLPGSPIAFPDLPRAEVARWLLMDWWEAHGRSLATRQWILESWEAAAELGGN